MKEYNSNKTHRPNIKHISEWAEDFAYYYYFKPYLSDNHSRCRDIRKAFRKRAKRKENEYFRNIINDEIAFYEMEKEGYELDVEVEMYMDYGIAEGIKLCQII